MESYTPDPGTDDGIYSYKPNKLWKKFIETAVDSASTNILKLMKMVMQLGMGIQLIVEKQNLLKKL